MLAWITLNISKTYAYAQNGNIGDARPYFGSFGIYGSTYVRFRQSLYPSPCHSERRLAESKNLSSAQQGHGLARCFARLSMTMIFSVSLSSFFLSLKESFLPQTRNKPPSGFILLSMRKA